MYLEIVEQLFKENLLVKGDLEILGHKVDLTGINQPLFLIAGTRDDITPPDQLFAIENYVSSSVVDKKLADAGHIGVFMGKNVIKDIWTDLFKRLPACPIKVEPVAQCVRRA
jgi:poly(3-hydroxyalkanoate) synthetase